MYYYYYGQGKVRRGGGALLTQWPPRSKIRERKSGSTGDLGREPHLPRWAGSPIPPLMFKDTPEVQQATWVSRANCPTTGTVGFFFRVMLLVMIQMLWLLPLVAGDLLWFHLSYNR